MVSENPERNPESESVFEATSDIEITRVERITRILDSRILVPIRVMINTRRGAIGSFIFVSFILLGTVGQMIIPEPSYQQGPRALQPFSHDNIFLILGTNTAGFSLLSMLTHATPAMLKMTFSGAMFSTGVAAMIGTIAGFKGGSVDKVLSTITDIVMTLPGLPLTLILAAIFGVSDPLLIGIILSINSWGGLARKIRSQILSNKQSSHVEASQCMGISTRKIITWNLMPNIMPFVLVNFMRSAQAVIFGAVGLYFLGLLPFSQPNWGTILNNAYQSGQIWTSEAYLFHISLITIIIYTLSLILLAQSMDRLFNPRIRARHSTTTPSDDNS